MGDLSEIEEIVRALPRPSPAKLAVGATLLLGAFAVVYMNEAADMTDGLALLAAMLGGYVLWLGVQERRPITSPVVRALLHDPLSIVWVYDRSAWRGAHQIGEVHVHFVDGDRALLVSPVPEGAGKLVDVFRRRAPSATFGWDAETELRFKTDPASLRPRRA